MKNLTEKGQLLKEHFTEHELRNMSPEELVDAYNKLTTVYWWFGTYGKYENPVVWIKASKYPEFHYLSGDYAIGAIDFLKEQALHCEKIGYNFVYGNPNKDVQQVSDGSGFVEGKLNSWPLY